LFPTNLQPYFPFKTLLCSLLTYNPISLSKRCVVPWRERASYAAAECVPLLRHKSKAKVGSEVQSWARASGGNVLASDVELFDDAEGVQ
jgi:hypothetical protein